MIELLITYKGLGELLQLVLLLQMCTMFLIWHNIAQVSKPDSIETICYAGFPIMLFLNLLIVIFVYLSVGMQSSDYFFFESVWIVVFFIICIFRTTNLFFKKKKNITIRLVVLIISQVISLAMFVYYMSVYLK